MTGIKKRNKTGVDFYNSMTKPKRIFHPIHIRDLIRRHLPIRERLQQQQQEAELLARIRHELPASLAEHCGDARRQGNHLTLFVDSPVWATRMRFSLPNLTRHLADLGIERVEQQIRPPASRPAAPPSRKSAREITPGAAAHLQAAAQHIRDPELARLFRRLALRGTTRQDNSR